ncbi:hypothetical protein C1T31_11545 [Hanstruepera neustonica]|uniref:Uncharacterized protein n=1 Tax=Hanstruepera neustonica TaxID=1445657 RepID=A0A2K1DWM2_9FLAO|nr:hypothetical protein [Hanstruepera neustonica]PNQ72421.1 hypothetical protein C1T31_11545 [Hanstruepera neustonica]
MKIVIFLLLSIFLFKCKNDEVFKLKDEISSLKAENDSLNNIIRNKFIFDNADLRIIPSIKNSKTLDSKFEGELVIVGFNDDDITILNGEWNYKNSQYENGDTIKNHYGAYKLNLDKVKNDTLNFYVKIDNKYGSRSYDSIMSYPYEGFWKLK